MKFEFIIPAYNEANYIAQIVEDIRLNFGRLARIIVVDNSSLDETAALALKAGADEVVFEPRQGKGYAVVAGARAALNNRVFVCDADVRGLPWDIAKPFLEPDHIEPYRLVRADLCRTAQSAPVTSLLALPMLSALGFSGVREPLGGVFSIEKSVLLTEHLIGGWGFDLSLTLFCFRNSIAIREIQVHGVRHRKKELSSYIEMADEIARTFCGICLSNSWDHSDCTRGCI